MITVSPHRAAPLQAQVYGAGPTGALAALALARAGWRVQLLDPLTAAQLTARSRAYALTHSSRQLLQSLELWEPLQPALAPFRRLELCDRALHRQVRFSSADLGREPAAAVGWILQHQPLMALLLEGLQAEPAITLQLGAAPPLLPVAPVDLRVAADGHNSATAAAAGLRRLGFRYRQGCLTVQVRLRGSDPDQAWELFRPEGPFAVLPLGGDAYQLVWSAPLDRLRRLEQLDGAAFLDALSAALPEALQAEVLLDQPRAWPVGLSLLWPLARGRLLALGEAAHRCHPVGGQGLNLCWRDVACLQQLAARCSNGRLQPAQLPRAYAWRRLPDLLLVLLATDGLVRLFSNRLAPLLPLRRLALLLLGRWAWLRTAVLAVMTHGPCRWPLS
ncbi:MAG: FAD-dependent monooxygenase [Vulcanococcus sp.]